MDIGYISSSKRRIKMKHGIVLKRPPAIQLKNRIEFHSVVSAWKSLEIQFMVSIGDMKTIQTYFLKYLICLDINQLKFRYKYKRYV